MQIPRRSMKAFAYFDAHFQPLAADVVVSIAAIDQCSKHIPSDAAVAVAASAAAAADELLPNAHHDRTDTKSPDPKSANTRDPR